jgi:hypothetical protein
MSSHFKKLIPTTCIPARGRAVAAAATCVLTVRAYGASVVYMYNLTFADCFVVIGKLGAFAMNKYNYYATRAQV